MDLHHQTLESYPNQNAIPLASSPANPPRPHAVVVVAVQQCEQGALT